MKDVERNIAEINVGTNPCQGCTDDIHRNILNLPQYSVCPKLRSRLVGRKSKTCYFIDVENKSGPSYLTKSSLARPIVVYHASIHADNPSPTSSYTSTNPQQ